MDANKAEKLREIGYQLPGACGNCQHGNFSSNSAIFGTCDEFFYLHLKHGEDRALSINRYGSCSDYQMTEEYEYIVEHFVW